MHRSRRYRIPGSQRADPSGLESIITPFRSAIESLKERPSLTLNERLLLLPPQIHQRTISVKVAVYIPELSSGQRANREVTRGEPQRFRYVARWKRHEVYELKGDERELSSGRRFEGGALMFGRESKSPQLNRPRHSTTLTQLVSISQLSRSELGQNLLHQSKAIEVRRQKLCTYNPMNLAKTATPRPMSIARLVVNIPSLRLAAHPLGSHAPDKCKSERWRPSIPH